MLLRVDMPGLNFDALELRFEECPASRTSQLSYRPDSLDDLLAWNEADLDEDSPSSTALYELMVACYAQWRSEGGWCNAAMEASLAADVPVEMVRLAPQYVSLRSRASMALQRWLGLLDATPRDCEMA